MKDFCSVLVPQEAEAQGPTHPGDRGRPAQRPQPAGRLHLFGVPSEIAAHATAPGRKSHLWITHSTSRHRRVSAYPRQLQARREVMIRFKLAVLVNLPRDSD